MDRIIVFGRYPVPGKVKTRLIPALGTAGAAECHRKLSEDSVRTALAASRNDRAIPEFCCDGATGEAVENWLGENELRFTLQSKGGLGQRMQAAFMSAFSRGAEKAVLVGTDIPGMTPAHLADALELLDDNDLVLGPSVDGGYWLVGMKKPLDIFRQMPWGTDRVFENTMESARKLGLTTGLIDTLRDIDTPQDLAQWTEAEQVKRPFISVIIPALNEAKRIERTIRTAEDPSVEIIVVDGGSSDETLRRARDCDAIVMSSPGGRAVQQNSGALEATGRVLLFLHADTLLPAGYPAAIFNILMNRRNILGAFRFKTDFRHPGMNVIEAATNIRSGFFHLPYGDQALFMRRSDFDDIGGFPRVPIAEDLFLVRRMAKKGNIRIAEEPVVTSGRRWTSAGIVRTTVINYIIAAGCLAGVPPEKLAPLYRASRKKKNHETQKQNKT